MTYAALLAFYLHLRASGKYSARPELLRQHPVLKRLLTLKQSLTTLEDLNFNSSDSEDEFDSEEDEDDESMSDNALDEFDTWLAARKHGLDVGELEGLEISNTPAIEKPKPKPKSKVDPPPKKKQKALNGKALPKIVFDVEEPTLPKAGPSTTKKSQSSTADAFGFGEATALDDADVADKGGRRKALRFHTSKIESASARRQGARNALGGDDDVPYRDRKKQGEKQKRSNLGAGGADLDDADPEPREQARKRGRDEESDGASSAEDDDDGYYSLVKKQKNASKAEKKAQYDAVKEANRCVFLSQLVPERQLNLISCTAWTLMTIPPPGSAPSRAPSSQTKDSHPSAERACATHASRSARSSRKRRKSSHRKRLSTRVESAIPAIMVASSRVFRRSSRVSRCNHVSHQVRQKSKYR